MSQSGFIAALLLAAFILFLAAQDRLVKYAAVLWGDTGKTIPKAAPKQSSGGTIGDIASTAGSVVEGASFLGIL